MVDRARGDGGDRRPGDPVHALLHAGPARPTAGPSTATACSASRTAATTATCWGPPEEFFTADGPRVVTAKDFPLLLFQIQTKYRQARPLAGIPARARVRDEEGFLLVRHRRGGLKTVYHAHRRPINERCSTGWRSVRHRLGGIPAPWAAVPRRSSWPKVRSGGDTFVRCLRSGYAANVEAVTTAVPGFRSRSRDWNRQCTTPATPQPSPPWSTGPAARGAGARDHPQPTRAENVLLKDRQPGGDWEAAGVSLPGSRVDDKQLGAALEPADYAMIGGADFARYPFLRRGYIGRNVAGQRGSLSR